MQCDLQNIERVLSTPPGRMLQRLTGAEEARQEVAMSILKEGERAERTKPAPHRYLAFRTVNRWYRQHYARRPERTRPEDIPVRRNGVAFDPAVFDGEVSARSLHADYGYDRDPFDLIKDPHDRALVRRYFYALRKRGTRSLRIDESPLADQDTLLAVARDHKMSVDVLRDIVADVVSNLDPVLPGG